MHLFSRRSPRVDSELLTFTFVHCFWHESNSNTCSTHQLQARLPHQLWPNQFGFFFSVSSGVPGAVVSARALPVSCNQSTTFALHDDLTITVRQTATQAFMAMGALSSPFSCRPQPRRLSRITDSASVHYPQGLFVSPSSITRSPLRESCPYQQSMCWECSRADQSGQTSACPCLTWLRALQLDPPCQQVKSCICGRMLVRERQTL